METNNNSFDNNVQNENSDHYEDYDNFLHEIERENFDRDRQLLDDKEKELKQKEQLIRQRQIRFMIANLNLTLNEPDVPALRDVVKKSVKYARDVTCEDINALHQEWLSFCMFCFFLRM